MRMTYGGLALILGFFVYIAVCQDQIDAGKEPPLKVTLCDLYKEPQRFSGKMVQVRGSITGHKEPELQDFSGQASCSGYFTILLVLPADVNPAPGFRLEVNSSFQKYQQALHESARIEATMEGRFDSVLDMRDEKLVRGGNPYGKKHLADGRLVLHRMTDIATWPIPRR